MVEGGSVSWQFEQVGVLEIKKGDRDDEGLEMIIIESGAKDYQKDDDIYNVFTQIQDLKKVKETLEATGVEILDAQLAFVAKDKIKLDEGFVDEYEKLWETLDEHDDVANIFDNIE